MKVHQVPDSREYIDYLIEQNKQLSQTVDELPKTIESLNER